MNTERYQRVFPDQAGNRACYCEAIMGCHIHLPINQCGVRTRRGQCLLPDDHEYEGLNHIFLTYK